MISNRKGRSLSTTVFLLIAAYFFLVWLPLSRLHAWQHKHPRPAPIQLNTLVAQDTIHLNSATERYPITSYIPLPTSPSSIPKIQHDFPPESRAERKARVKKQKVIKDAFMHSWNGYKDHAWMRDEVSPQTGGYQDSFSGWGATLVDSLDALIIMGLDDELDLALDALDQIDFTTTRSKEVNVFEIIIRYMGGFLAAHDLSNGKHPILLKKAEELGDMIFNAFDTHNRMPQMRWDWSKYVDVQTGSLTIITNTLFIETNQLPADLPKAKKSSRLPIQVWRSWVL